MAKKKKTFEESIQQLEKIVEDLETGDLPLEDALKKFEEGVDISKICSKKLDEIEKKVSVLLKDKDGEVIKKPFDEEDLD